jgi:hypothetical protein
MSFYGVLDSAVRSITWLRCSCEKTAGGIVMTGRLATQVAKDPRIHLVGYGPSASTIGANRAGAAAAHELTSFLGLRT